MFKRINDFLSRHKKTRIFLKTLQWLFTIFGIVTVVYLGLLLVSILMYSNPKTSMIQFMTSGTIEPKSPLTVSFKKAVVDYKKVGQEETKPLMKLSPSVKGTLKWSRTNILEFIPESPLEPNKTYTFKVFVRKAFPDQSGIVKVEKSKITILGQRVGTLKHDWKPASLHHQIK
jgi:hypothetical protein